MSTMGLPNLLRVKSQGRRLMGSAPLVGSGSSLGWWASFRVLLLKSQYGILAEGICGGQLI